MVSSPCLTLDLGNTSLKVLLWEDGVVSRRWRVFPSDPDASDRLPEFDGIQEARGVRVPGRPEPDLPASWPEVLWAGESLGLPGSVRYLEPGEMGADRRVAAWGARSLHGQALVVDCGTALTLTHVDSQGGIEGLGISIGFAALRQGLAEAAPALAPYLSEEAPVPVGIPEGSAENLSLGTTQGWAGLLCRLVEEARHRLSGPAPIVLTGSDAVLAAELLGEGEIQPDLLHLGLLQLERLA